MTVFDKYAAYYELLYRDKNYSEEADYIDSLIKKLAPESKTILDMGCGSGSHLLLLAKKGYLCTGIDRSESMIRQAKNKLGGNSSGKLEFITEDIRKLNLNRRFDVITSLFHVMSYQVENSDIEAVLSRAAKHLEPGGLFIFDSWYGPAVLSDPPVVRVKRMQNEKYRVKRIAEPEMHYNRNLVDVHFNVFVESIENGEVEKINETHKMRYLFKPEMEIFLFEHGFSLKLHSKWLTDEMPGPNSWYTTWVAKLAV